MAKIDRSGMEPEVQTTKSKTKEVPCMGCRRPLIVNTFYAPTKARCSDCKGESTSTISPAMRAAIAPRAPDPEVVVEPNRSLADLRCPFDDNPMILIRVQPVTGFTTFECQQCMAAVQIMPEFSALLISQIPEALKPLVHELNCDQIEWAQALERGGEIKRDPYRNRGLNSRARAARRIGHAA
jgi:hypothetical protein